MRMQRQKVKGTGHKLPADAETEPNFYSMPTAATLSSSSPEPESPGMQGLRGAANLLQGISAGLPPAALLAKPVNRGMNQGSLTYTASTANPQHWQYASAVARHTALVEKESQEKKVHQGHHGNELRPPQQEPPPPPSQVKEDRRDEQEDGEKKQPVKDVEKEHQSHGDKATDKP